MSKQVIIENLEWLESIGVIRSWILQSNMPGRRWTIDAVGFRGTRCYSTAEIEAFLHGADAMRQRQLTRVVACSVCGSTGHNARTHPGT